MTFRTNSRVAGVLFLAYIATGLTQLALFTRLTAGSSGTAETLSRLAANPGAARLNALLALVTGFEAIILGAALFALTRDVDRDLAVIAFACRLGEGVVNSISAAASLALLGVATAAAAATGASAEAHVAVGAYLLRDSILVSATLFAVGSAFFSWLFLKVRDVPRWLAQLGVAASVLLVVLLPAQMLGAVRGTVANLIWLPMLVFEVVFALWLIARGVGGRAIAVPEGA